MPDSWAGEPPRIQLTQSTTSSVQAAVKCTAAGLDALGAISSVGMPCSQGRLTTALGLHSTGRPFCTMPAASPTAIVDSKQMTPCRQAQPLLCPVSDKVQLPHLGSTALGQARVRASRRSHRKAESESQCLDAVSPPAGRQLAKPPQAARLTTACCCLQGATIIRCCIRLQSHLPGSSP